MDFKITHNKDTLRFETEVEGFTASIEYLLKDNTINILHTRVPRPIEGKGIAAALTKYVLEYAKETRLKVIPTCSYTQAYVERHNEYKALCL